MTARRHRHEAFIEKSHSRIGAFKKQMYVMTIVRPNTCERQHEEKPNEF